MSITNNLTAGSIRKKLPSRVISGLVNTAESLESWLYDDASGDPWWQGSGGAAYRWKITAELQISSHSSHLSREPFSYSGLDITPGMWVMSGNESRAVKVISIIMKSINSIICIVEDIDRHNTFSDTTSSGTGIFSTPNTIVFFELGDDGLPIINPIPLGIDINIVSQVESRFRVFNPTIEYRFFQIKHNFKEGQVLRLNPDSGGFEQATSNDIYFVGTVTSVGPGPNYFYLSPSTKFLQNLEPGLSGKAGDIIWLDPITGDRTITPNGSNVPIYIQMTNAVPTFTIGEVINPTTFGSNSIKINGVTIVMGGALSVVTATNIITLVNSKTSNTGVTASISSPENAFDGSRSYPSATPDVELSFDINGINTLINTPSINFGTSGSIGFWDVVRSVNEQTHLHGVSVSMNVYNGKLTFVHKAGGNINFINVTPTITMGENKTFTDMVGVSLVNAPSTPNRIKLTRYDGGEIIAANVNGDTLGDIGVQSVANGTMPLPLIVDKTMIANQNYVIANMTDRDNMTNLRTGDQVFVQSADNMEWALYVRTGDTWTKISDYDSANTDANTLTINVDTNSISPASLGNISSGTRIVNVTVVVTEAFNNINALLSVGVLGNTDIIASSANIDLTVIGSYETGSSFIYSGLYDGEILVFINSAGSTVGKAKIIASYL